MFTFADNDTDNPAFGINDRGTVLFPERVWKADGFQNLVTDHLQIAGYPLAWRICSIQSIQRHSKGQSK